MNNILLYLIQSGISLSVLYVIYWFFMRKDTYFRINRFYLLISVVFSFMLPLFNISLPFTGSNTNYVYLLDAITITPGQISESINQNYNIYQIIGIVYLTGVGIFTMRFIFQLFQIGLLIHQYGISKNAGFHLVITNPRFTPFSFFNIIFLGNDVNDQRGLDKIITHEKVHIQQKHSIDIILLELFTIVQWFNPFIWFYKSSLKNIHEFLADEGVLIEGINKTDYQELLLNQSIGIQLIGVSNNFSPVRMAWPRGQSLIKRRFIMMSKSKTKNVMLLKMVFILPLALLLTIVFSSMATEKAQEKSEGDAVKLTTNSIPQEDEVFTVVEKMPEYPGGNEERVKFLVKNIKYPEEARKNGISGTVFISFIVEKDGHITNAKVLKGVDELLDNEALRVVKMMPAWKPGIQRGEAVRVQFNLPIQFNLDSGSKKDKDGEQKDSPSPKQNK